MKRTYCCDCGTQLSIDQDGNILPCVASESGETMTFEIDRELTDDDGGVVCVSVAIDHRRREDSPNHKTLVAWGKNLYDCINQMSEQGHDADSMDVSYEFYNCSPDHLLMLLRDSGEGDHLCAMGYTPKVTCTLSTPDGDAQLGTIGEGELSTAGKKKGRVYFYTLQHHEIATNTISGQFKAEDDKQAYSEIDQMMASYTDYDLILFQWTTI